MNEFLTGNWTTCELIFGSLGYVFVFIAFLIAFCLIAAGGCVLVGGMLEHMEKGETIIMFFKKKSIGEYDIMIKALSDKILLSIGFHHQDTVLEFIEERARLEIKKLKLLKKNIGKYSIEECDIVLKAISEQYSIAKGLVCGLEALRLIDRRIKWELRRRATQTRLAINANPK